MLNISKSNIFGRFVLIVLIKKMCAVHDIFFHKLSMSPINKKNVCDSGLELQIDYKCT